ncbi:MAG: hypothetical protein JXQ73_14475 [Phycisphaerae bacterium]|nr:hypothetical protein [Phycisphaerae bacterium]
MYARALQPVMSLLIAAACLLTLAPRVEAKPITTVGELAAWDPNHRGDLPPAIQKADPNAAVIARDTLDVLPDMMTKMETVILDLTKDRTRVRLNELLASLMPAEGKPPVDAVQTFVIAQIAAKLDEAKITIPLSELEELVAAVEGGPAKQLVEDLAKQGAQIPLAALLQRVEKSPKDIRDFFRPTVMIHLEHGRVGTLAALVEDEADDPWSIPLTELAEKAKTQPKPVADYVTGLPVWVANFRITEEAPDVPIHQLLDMLAKSREAYAKLVARPLVTDKDLEAPGKVAYMLQEAYARSEQINMDLIGRNVIGIGILASLLILFSALRGYINVLDIPNKRITE